MLTACPKLLVIVLMAVLLVAGCREGQVSSAEGPDTNPPGVGEGAQKPGRMVSGPSENKGPGPKQSHIRIEPSKTVEGRPEVLESKEGATAEEVGFVFYPGATVNRSTVMKDRGHVAAAAELETRDRYRDVVEFYRDTYADKKPRTRPYEAEKRTTLNWQDPRGNYTVVIRQDAPNARTVITLARTLTVG